jgi:pimeloyl-ACP methyl ester carboxylesterase
MLNAMLNLGQFARPVRALCLGLGVVVIVAGVTPAQSQTTPITPTPIPAQAPAKDGMAQVPGSQLWGYQQPVFAKAGYRVIGYSRRGYINSAPFDRNNAGIGSEDLRALVDHLGLGRFHLVASAAGGSIASEFTFSYQPRLLSLTISSNSFGVRDGEIAKAAAFIRPKGWDDMPAEFRELGPSYRAANPEGVKAWMELEHKALIGREFRQPLKNEITQARLKELKLPVLLIAGAADMSTPPSMSRMIAAEIPGSRVALIPESGHSTYWEQPELFNRAVLDHVSTVK